MPAIDRAAAAVARACRDAADCRALRLAVLAALRPVVPFDAYAWVITDPETEVGTAPLADVPCLPELPRLVRLKYLTPVNRWTALAGPAATLHGTTGGVPDRSLVWRELLCRYGVRDVASVVFRDRFGCWAFLDLWRNDGTFDGDETALLGSVAPAVTEALRRCQAATFESATFEAAGEPAGRRGPVVLVLSADLDVRAQTPETDAYLRALVPPDAGQPPVPAGALNVAAQLLATEAGVDAHPPWARVHLGGGDWRTLRAARIGDPGGDVAVTIEPATAAERCALFARAHGLSDRETELLTHLLAGTATTDVARAMFVSGHTVQDHLKSIFAKTGVRTRAALLARATGR